MKIAVSSEGPSLDARVWQKFGSSPFLIIVDPDTGEFEAIRNPGASGGSGGGMQAVALAISEEVGAVLTGYCGPTAENFFAARNIQVIPGLSGTVSEVLEEYRKGRTPRTGTYEKELGKGMALGPGSAFRETLIKSGRQFATMLPILAGVVLLLGLFHALVSKDLLRSIFTGRAWLDTLLGASLGSIFAGNPINSYVLGGEMLERGISLFAVTALITAWVSVGLVQLPAEMAALGKRFALVRNAASFVMSVFIAGATVMLWSFLRG